METAPPLVHDLWRDALDLFTDRPDLSLLRCRQLIEVLATHAEMGLQVRQARDQLSLGERVRRMQAEGLIDRPSSRGLEEAIRDSNDAVHMNRVAAPKANAHSAAAQQALGAISRAWSTYMRDGTHLVIALPVGVSVTHRAAFDAHALLDQAEAAIAQRRDNDAAETLIAAARARAKGARLRGIAWDMVDARAEGIQLSIRNHDGEPPRPADSEIARLRRLWDSGQPAARELAVRLANRLAVSHTNVLDLDGARAVLSRVLPPRETALKTAPYAADRSSVRDYTLGALHGTVGLVEALTAHAFNDAEHLDVAALSFQEAMSCLYEEDDLERHRTNLMHVLVERVRLGAALTTDQAAQLDHLIDTTTIEPLLGEGDEPVRWHLGAFRVAAALKACALIGRRPPWAPLVLRALRAVDQSTVLKHPYPQLVGWATRIDPTAPRRWRAALERTRTASGTAPLLAWICTSFLEPVSPSPPPAELQPWWNTYGIAAMNRTGPAWWLPFNYA